MKNLATILALFLVPFPLATQQTINASFPASAAAGCTPPAGATYDYDVANAANYCTSGTTVCANGLGIYELKDSIAGNTAVQATGANQPIYTTGAINGLPAAVFTATSSQSIQMTTQVPTTNAYYSLYYVFQLPSLSYTLGVPEGRYQPWIQFNGGGVCSSGQMQDALTGACSSTFISASTWYAVGIQINAATGAYSFHKYAGSADISEGSGTTGAAVVPANSPLNWLGYASGAYSTSSMARLIYYDSALPAGLAAYTACKYGL